MKKVGAMLGLLIAVSLVFMFVNKLHYPPLPTDDLSAKEAIALLEEADRKIAEIAVEDDSIWYIMSSENKGISIADENIKQMISSYGWGFKEKDGAGLFFEKDGERLIATTQMWTGNYVLVNIPSNFK